MLSISLNDFKRLSGVQFLNISESMFALKHVKDISIDSRSIEPDQVFWALSGERFNGHDFVKEAQQKSALFCVVAENELERQQYGPFPMVVVPDTLNALHELAHLQRMKYRIPVIGITGSNAKTTVKEMLAHILQTRMVVHKTKGNLNNQVGCPQTLLNLNEHHDAAVIELGTNQFGEIEILTKMASPNHGLITMIGDTHLEFLGSREGVFREKRALFDHMEDVSTIYLNMDDPILSTYEPGKRQVVRYSCQHKTDVYGDPGPLDKNGCGKLRLNDRVDIQLQVVGIHNMYNALAASAVALNLNCGESEIRDALETFQATDKRMQVIEWNGIKIINDTYNANPVSMKSAVDTLGAIMHDGKTVLVLGDMFELGTNALDLHVDVLKHILSGSPDRLYLAGPIMEEAIAKCTVPASVKIVISHSHEQIAELLRQYLQPGDLLLLKGSRGMQMERVLAHL